MRSSQATSCCRPALVEACRKARMEGKYLCALLDVSCSKTQPITRVQSGYLLLLQITDTQTSQLLYQGIELLLVRVTIAFLCFITHVSSYIHANNRLLAAHQTIHTHRYFRLDYPRRLIWSEPQTANVRSSLTRRGLSLVVLRGINVKITLSGLIA